MNNDLQNTPVFVLAYGKKWASSITNVAPRTNAYHRKGGFKMIGEIVKNTREKIRISVTEYKEHWYIDCRVYFEGKEGNWLPTKKGIALNADAIDGVIELLKEASKELKGNFEN
jgi:hypothetical protein